MDAIGRMRALADSPGGLLAASFIIGMLTRVAVLPFTYDYDIYHWAVVLQNINSGNGLYEMDGYYYTPVWGYILGFMDLVWNSFLSIDVYGTKVWELLGVQDFDGIKHVATVTSPEFNTAVKSMLILVDIAVGLVIRRLVTSLTGDNRKGDLGFALWFLCPLTIYMSSVQATFDNISGLLTLLSLILVLRRHHMLGGVLLMTGILLKLYPVFAAPVVLALIYSRSGTIRKTASDASAFIAGGLIAFLAIMGPSIADGTVRKAFTFITDRMGSGPLIDQAFGMVGIVLGLTIMLYATYRMAACGKERSDSEFLGLAMIALSGGVVSNMGPQYPLVVLPILCAYIAAKDGGFRICWVLIGCGCALEALALNNYSLLMSLASYGPVQFDTIISGLEWTEAEIVYGTSFRSIMNTVFSMVAMSGLFLIVLLYIREDIEKRMPKVGALLSRIRSGGDTDA